MEELFAFGIPDGLKDERKIKAKLAGAGNAGSKALTRYLMAEKTISGKDGKKEETWPELDVAKARHIN